MNTYVPGNDDFREAHFNPQPQGMYYPENQNIGNNGNSSYIGQQPPANDNYSQMMGNGYSRMNDDNGITLEKFSLPLKKGIS